MKYILVKISPLLISIIATTSTLAYAVTVSPAANGIQYPAGLKNWRVVGSSYRNDNDTQRVILGNSIAIKASRAEQTNPWPKGTILAKLVWKNKQHPKWGTAIIPGEFVHAEIMVKDSIRYKSTGGWGYARWQGLELKPYGEDESFSQECLSCHNQVKSSDSVFTIPAKMP